MNALRSLNVGVANFVLSNMVDAQVSSGSAPTRRPIWRGRRFKSVAYATESIIGLAIVSQETLARRLTSIESVSDGP